MMIANTISLLMLSLSKHEDLKSVLRQAQDERCRGTQP